MSPGLPSHPRRDHDLAERYALVVALQHDWPRLAFMAVERAAGDPGDWLVVYDRLAVQHDRDPAADERDVVRLWFSRLVGGVDIRVQQAVDASHPVRVHHLPRVILDLHLVSASQVDATVAARRERELGVQLEVRER